MNIAFPSSPPANMISGEKQETELISGQKGWYRRDPEYVESNQQLAFWL